MSSITPENPRDGAGASFRRDSRLSSRREFSRVFSRGHKTVGRNVILWHWHGEPRGPRLGLSVSAKVGLAVRRNRLKRLAREAFRLNRVRLRPGSDIVIYFRPGCRWRGLEEAQEDLMDLWRKGRLLAESPR